MVLMSFTSSKSGQTDDTRNLSLLQPPGQIAVEPARPRQGPQLAPDLLGQEIFMEETMDPFILIAIMILFVLAVYFTAMRSMK